MITSIIRIKKFTLLIILSFFAACLSSVIHAKDFLPAVKNDTPWEVTFMYSWVGCGPFHKWKKGGGDRHYKNVKIAQGGTYTLSEGCLSRQKDVHQILAINPKIKHGNPTVGVIITLGSNGHVSSINGNGYSCNGSSCALTLKYSSSSPPKNAVEGFYWASN